MKWRGLAEERRAHAVRCRAGYRASLPVRHDSGRCRKAALRRDAVHCESMCPPLALEYCRAGSHDPQTQVRPGRREPCPWEEIFPPRGGMVRRQPQRGSTARATKSQERKGNFSSCECLFGWCQYFGKIAGLGNLSSNVEPFRYSSRGMCKSGQLAGRTRMMRVGRIPSVMRSVSKRIWIPLLPRGGVPGGLFTSWMGPRAAI